ncbi:DUF4139 domain-containing protein [Pelagerythrobacter rhizovicinus]|uniref:DUF4139 domain-containing protein n=1 Tax=Pelagerythrobacter rhizovicinus TaxID=2268576 RepID=A0A4Q2KIH8_9SPHN|nr:hypothetical protein [Pelagerythrobacter rhizovicinus]RXZ63980.1 hypothetical protein ETX26_08535 [Pelagerythrobacter rhizovicinus]
MRRAAFLLALIAASAAAQARETVDASAPVALAVTVYRDPERGPDEAMDRAFPEGFAMVSETRTVTLPPGESTVRFEGVAEGMVAVSAIVTGLPGGTIEKNRNAELLSPAALVNGMLGNRVTITRANPATGEAASEPAIVRTRADGGLVLQTGEGFEAVRCAGLPEKLTFDRVPAGLSAQPVFSIDTRDASGGTYQIVLTYLAWGFDWQANYVATLGEGDGRGGVELGLTSWLTLLNDNAQSFSDAELMAVAGRLNVEGDYESLAEPPRAEPLRLTCYPIGSTARGSPVGYPPPPPPPPPPAMAATDEAIILTGSRVQRTASPAAMMAAEEELGDLKLYRVPEPVTVAAKGLKQVAFLQKDEIEGELIYEIGCSANRESDEEFRPAERLLATVNDEAHGLGVALPSGGVAVFEPSSHGPLLVGEERLRDYARGQDVEIALGTSGRVRVACTRTSEHDPATEPEKWARMEAEIANALDHPARLRVRLGTAADWEVRGRGLRIKDGERVIETTIPANSDRKVRWRVRSAHR